MIKTPFNENRFGILINMKKIDSNKRVSTRKDDHIRITIKEDVSSGFTNGLENFVLEHCALPEMALDEVDTSCSFLGHQLNMPLIISSMTGGSKLGGDINRNLAEAAQYQGVALGLGSQRSMWENPELAYSYQVRKYAPDIPIFGNIGAVQLNYGCSAEDCINLVQIIEANGLIIHLNPLQEALQPEGQTNFSGLLKKIETLCNKAKFPIIAKEVGWGISADATKKLINAGVSVIDVAGAGGLSWSQVEAHRTKYNNEKDMALLFKNWGIPTANALIETREVNKEIPVIASGGIRNGIEIAKCLALGANICGMAGRLIKAGSDSKEAVINEIEIAKKTLRVAIFTTGSNNLSQLSQNKITPIGLYESR
jgi:isopentenyl-diphosphate delta-isomerase